MGLIVTINILIKNLLSGDTYTVKSCQLLILTQVCCNYEHVKVNTSTDVCMQCCSGSFCNSQGCGGSGELHNI